MSKAEQRSKEIMQAALDYANNLDDIKPTDELRRNLCISLGQAFMKGAEWADKHQAEKDNKLTWEDIVEIDKLLIDLGMMFPVKSTPDYYDEVLKRFKERKEK